VAVLGLLIVIIAGIPRLGSVDYTYAPNGLTGIFGAAVLVFFAFVGFDNIANLSEEVKKPAKTLPKGFIISIAVTTALYAMVGISAVSLVPPEKLAASNAPLALAASMTFGGVAYDVLTAAALLTTLNTVLVLLITSSRIIYGMARAGELPRIMGRIHSNTNAPAVASFAVLAVALLFLPIGKIDVVAEVTSFGALITFMMVNIALLNLRRVEPMMHRPFKAPLNIGWISVTALLGVLSCIVLLTQFSQIGIVFGMVLPISGILIYEFSHHFRRR
jgi:APA family basic amino acid/polyamine antiporter